jgi:predicted alpha-1,2-mannosidase
MKKYVLPAVLALAIWLNSCDTEKTDYIPTSLRWEFDSATTHFSAFVDPMIGTDGHGHTFPGATAPFGMVQLSPDTRVDGSWDGCSGYHYSDSIVYGFSHTHLSGTGCSDYGDILIMPGKGEIRFSNGADGKVGYSSKFSHTNEKAEAGYYSLKLDNSNTVAELTASPRVGMHRYTFSSKDQNWILLDLVHRDEVIDSKLEIVNDHTVRGYRFSKAWATNQRLWFYAEFSEPFSKHEFESLGALDSVGGKNVKCAFHFSGEKPVLVKLALSPVSCENAAMNMQAEIPNWDFDLVRKKVKANWDAELSKIEIQDIDERKKRIFYTALYHCFTAPNLYCDVNGDYQGMDHAVHRDTVHPQYTVFSLWDTYRALHPLFTIAQPKRNQDFINTFLKQYKEGGRLPVWELSANETDCMIGYHSIPVIVDAWMKGQTDFDTILAYEAMKASAMRNVLGLKEYKQFGFIPAEGESESVSKTLEYAYDDWCIALAAKRMKKEEDYRYFMRRAQSWKNTFDPETGFMRARLNNAFVNSFDPNEVNFHYTEANAWQYSLAVQQDILGLIEAHGGDEKFIAFLDKLFAASSKTSGREQADITGLIGQYAQGNEPSHHMAYLYMYTSQPWKTQELVSKICEEQYTDKPDGLCGNEDCGQMSAWYVMSMMGIYSVSPGNPVFHLGKPGVASITIHLPEEKKFAISLDLPLNANTTKSGTASSFIKSVSLNDKSYSSSAILGSEIMAGGSLKLGITTNENECIVFNNRMDSSFHRIKSPLTPRVVADFVPEGKLPILTRTFISKVNVRMQSEGATEVFASINGDNWQSVPFLTFSGAESSFSGYDLQLTETSSIRVFARDAAKRSSDTVSFSYYKIADGTKINLLTKYENQYAADGDNTLIDGIRGPGNFRTGSWQGYQGNNIEAIVDLGSSKNVKSISMGFLQDQNSWIFMPTEVQFLYSEDGKNFIPLSTEQNKIEAKAAGTILQDFSSQTTCKARYIKVIAVNRGTCPDNHPGKGNRAWIFSDEIVIETD